MGGKKRENSDEEEIEEHRKMHGMERRRVETEREREGD